MQARAVISQVKSQGGRWGYRRRKARGWPARCGRAQEVCRALEVCLLSAGSGGVRGLLDEVWDRYGARGVLVAYLLRSKRTTRSRVTSTLKPGSRGEERQSQGLLHVLRSGGADRACDASR